MAKKKPAKDVSLGKMNEAMKEIVNSLSKTLEGYNFPLGDAFTITAMLHTAVCMQFDDFDMAIIHTKRAMQQFESLLIEKFEEHQKTEEQDK